MVDDDNRYPDVKNAMLMGLRVGFRNLYLDTVKTVMRNMEEGKDALGQPFVPLARETVAAKGHAVPLVRSGDMRASIGTDSDIDLNNLHAEIGTSKNYLIHHEFGAPEAGIPRRPVLGPAARYAEQQAPEHIDAEIDTRLESVTI